FMLRDWHYRGADGQQHGPVSVAELQRLIEWGQVSPSALVWTPGMQQWVEASTVRALVPSGSPAVAAAAPTVSPQPAAETLVSSGEPASSIPDAGPGSANPPPDQPPVDGAA